MIGQFDSRRSPEACRLGPARTSIASVRRPPRILVQPIRLPGGGSAPQSVSRDWRRPESSYCNCPRSYRYNRDWCLGEAGPRGWINRRAVIAVLPINRVGGNRGPKSVFVTRIEGQEAPSMRSPDCHITSSPFRDRWSEVGAVMLAYRAAANAPGVRNARQDSYPAGWRWETKTEEVIRFIAIGHAVEIEQ